MPVPRIENDDFASRMCGYHKRSRTAFMLHGPHTGRKTKNQDIQNSNFADCFILV